jgi:guanine deaminase
MEDDRTIIQRAIEIAGEGIKNGGGPFGAVIVRDGKIIAESGNRVVLDSDPTAHAEIAAIRKAANVLNSHDLNGCILYCSCEPCPMCLGAIYWAGISRVVYASDRNDAADAGFSDRDIYEEIMLDPDQRRIPFNRVNNTEAGEVFRKWQLYEDRTSY